MGERRTEDLKDLLGGSLTFAVITALVWLLVAPEAGIIAGIVLGLLAAFGWYCFFRNRRLAGPRPSQFGNRGAFVEARVAWLKQYKQGVEERYSWEEVCPEEATELKRLLRELKTRAE